MSSSFQIQVFLSMFMAQLPTLIVSLAAIVMILSRWKGAPGASWALLGFGLTLVLCFAMPIGQAITQGWMVRGSGGDMQARSSVLFLISMVWSVLRGVTYAFLAMALFVGSARPRAAGQQS